MGRKIVLLFIIFVTLCSGTRILTVEGNKKVLVCNDSTKLCLMLHKEGETLIYNTDSSTVYDGFGFHSAIRKDTLVLVQLMADSGYAESSFWYKKYDPLFWERMGTFIVTKAQEESINYTGTKMLKFLAIKEKEIDDIYSKRIGNWYDKENDTLVNRLGRRMVNNYIKLLK